MSAAGTDTTGSARQHVHDRDVAQPDLVDANDPVAIPDVIQSGSGVQVAHAALAPGPYSAQQESQLQQAQLVLSNATGSEQQTLDSADAAAAPISESQEPVKTEEEVEEHPVRRVPWPARSGIQLDPIPAGSIAEVSVHVYKAVLCQHQSSWHALASSEELVHA